MGWKGSYLKNGDTLGPDDYLSSPNGEYVAYLKGDGNLILCYAVQPVTEPPTPDFAKVYWQTGPDDDEPSTALLKNNGDFVLFHGPDASVEPYWFTGTAIDPVSCAIQLRDDGNLVLLTGATPARPGELLWSAVPEVGVQCKFMENYRSSSPLNGGSDLVAVRDRDGNQQLFTIGTDGQVYSIHPDPASDAGYSETKISDGLTATMLAGGLDSSEALVLFVGGDTKLWVISQNDTGWSEPVAYGGMHGKPRQLVAANVGGELFLAVTQLASSGNFNIGFLQWGLDLAIRGVELSYTKQPYAYLGYDQKETATATWVSPDKLVFVPLYQRTPKVSFYSGVLDPAPVIDVSSPNGSTVFGVLDASGDYQVVQLVGTQENNHWRWLPLWEDAPPGGADYPVKFQSVAAEISGDGTVNVFAVSQPTPIAPGDKTRFNLLYHWTRQSQDLTPVPIFRSNGLQLSVVANDAGQIDVYTVDSAHQLTHIFAEESGENWQAQTIFDGTAAAGDIIPFSSYGTDITVYDSGRATIAETTVYLRASDRTRVTVNGATWFIDANTRATVTTNDSGILSIVEETGSLANAELWVDLPDLADSLTPTIVIEPYVDVQNRLATVSAEDLQQAECTDDQGNTSYLLAESIRDDPESLASLATACNTYIGEASTGAVLAVNRNPGRPGFVQPGLPDRHRFWSRQAIPAEHTGPLRRVKERAASVLRFTDDGQIRFQSLSAAEAGALIAERATLPSVTGIEVGAWWNKIGDLLQSVVDGIARILEVIDDGVKTFITVMINGAKYLFEAAVQLLQDAFDLVELVFARVAVFFQQLYQWLAWMFAWKDIRRVQAAATWVIDQTIEFNVRSVVQLKQVIDDGFDQYQAQIDSMFDSIINNLVGNYSVGGYDQRNDQPVAYSDEATSNNFILNDYTNHSDQASFTAPLPLRSRPALGSGDDPVLNFDEKAAVLTDAVLTSPAFASSESFWTALSNRPDQIFATLLSEVLGWVKGLVDAGLGAMRSFTDAALDMASVAMNYLRDLLNAPLSIPFVSAFYSWITGGQTLTLLNLFGMLVAIPTTFLYKLTSKGAPPFADDAALDHFKAATSVERMMQACGLAPMTPEPGGQPIYTLEEWEAKVLASLYLVTNLANTVLTAMNDTKDPTTPTPKPVMAFGVLLTVGSIATQFPWWYSNKTKPIIDTYGGPVLFVFVWILGIIFSDCLDERTGPPPTPAELARKSDKIAIALSMVGSFMLSMAAVNAVGESNNTQIAWQIITPFPTVVKFLRVQALVRRSSRRTLKLLAIIDGVFGVTSSGLGFAVLLSGNRSNPGPA